MQNLHVFLDAYGNVIIGNALSAMKMNGKHYAIILGAIQSNEKMSITPAKMQV